MSKIKLNLVAIIALLLVSNSCEKNEDIKEEKVTSADIIDIKAVVMAGDWKLSYYFDSVNDQTSDFEAYTFNFNEGGTLGATDGNSSLSGAWQIKTVSTDDETDEVNFKIHFSSSELLEKLSEDWQVKKYTDTKIELEHTNSEDAEVILLTFEK
ncbi:hypothetical protein JQC67_08405 [Aurantibacter crassamenti]|uniref:hypothetical protein n=1 Tax=Aurantibacter crassamenti TaxID=1837375 RepID=UPI001939A0BE|nr:hypothetical protein [Aurantibacter crassamenti]MBM1106154.1 hypothetical protein [Aurantibacter crassamenti]